LSYIGNNQAASTARPFQAFGILYQRKILCQCSCTQYAYSRCRWYNTLMSKSFLTKFNTLIQANVRGALRGGGRVKSGGNLDEEIASLRRQFEAAQQDQTAIEKDIAVLDEEILRLDAQVDDALRVGRDAEARYAVEQMERTRRKRTMMQAERDNHQHALGQLLVQINQLEALAQMPAQDTASDAPAQQSLSEAIRQARQSAESTRRIQVDIKDEETSEDDEAIEQELSVRRARLAKPDS